MLSDEPYTYEGVQLFKPYQQQLLRYAREGVRPSDLLQACLSDALFDAVGACDGAGEIAHLGVITSFIYSELPSACWGSRDMVDTYCRDAALRAKALHMCDAMSESPPIVPDGALSPDREVEHFVTDTSPEDVRIVEGEAGHGDPGVVE